MTSVPAVHANRAALTPPPAPLSCQRVPSDDESTEEEDEDEQVGVDKGRLVTPGAHQLPSRDSNRSMERRRAQTAVDRPPGPVQGVHQVTSFEEADISRGPREKEPRRPVPFGQAGHNRGVMFSTPALHATKLHQASQFSLADLQKEAGHMRKEREVRSGEKMSLSSSNMLSPPVSHSNSRPASPQEAAIDPRLLLSLSPEISLDDDEDGEGRATPMFSPLGSPREEEAERDPMASEPQKEVPKLRKGWNHMMTRVDSKVNQAVIGWRIHELLSSDGLFGSVYRASNGKTGVEV